jgi:orotate phosphoribosyltransferase
MGDLTLFLLSVITILDILHWRGVKIPYLTKSIHDNETKRLRELIDTVGSLDVEKTKNLLRVVYEREHSFLKVFEEERISLLLKQLRINSGQFDNVRSEIIRLRSLKSCSEQQRVDKITEIATSKLVLFDQSALPKRKYPHVRYYLNFLDVVVEPDLSHDISAMMKDHIYSKISDMEFAEQQYKIVIPYNGNLIFGKEIAAMIGCQFIKMRKDSFISDDRYWENNFLPSDKVIILNDVLVTSEQILNSIKKFPNKNPVKGFFCAISRTDVSESRPKSGKTLLEEAGIPVYPIVELCDNQIEQGIK